MKTYNNLEHTMYLSILLLMIIVADTISTVCYTLDQNLILSIIIMIITMVLCYIVRMDRSWYRVLFILLLYKQLSLPFINTTVLLIYILIAPILLTLAIIDVVNSAVSYHRYKINYESDILDIELLNLSDWDRFFIISEYFMYLYDLYTIQPKSSYYQKVLLLIHVLHISSVVVLVDRCR